MSGRGIKGNDALDQHAQHDRELAERVGIDRIDPKAGLDSKIPLRVQTEVVSTHERRETIVANKPNGPNKTDRK